MGVSLMPSSRVSKNYRDRERWYEYMLSSTIVWLPEMIKIGQLLTESATSHDSRRMNLYIGKACSDYETLTEFSVDKTIPLTNTDKVEELTVLSVTPMKNTQIAATKNESIRNDNTQATIVHGSR